MLTPDDPMFERVHMALSNYLGGEVNTDKMEAYPHPTVPGSFAVKLMASGLTFTVRPYTVLQEDVGEGDFDSWPPASKGA